MKNRLRFVAAPLIGLLVTASVACGGTPEAGESSSEPTVAPDRASAQEVTVESSQPPVTSGSPLASLRFEGVDYVQSGHAEFPLGEAVASFTIDGREINIDDLQVVGRSEGMVDGLDVYRLEDAGTGIAPDRFGRVRVRWRSSCLKPATCHPGRRAFG